MFPPVAWSTCGADRTANVPRTKWIVHKVDISGVGELKLGSSRKASCRRNAILTLYRQSGKITV